MNTLRGEDGSVQVIILGYLMVLITAITVIASATSLYVEHKRLLASADAAALAAAESFSLDDVSVSDGVVSPRLDTERVSTVVAEYVDEDRSAARFEAFRVLGAGTADSRSATVTLGADWRPPLVGPLLPAGLPLRVTSSARAVFR